ncbi:MAG: porin family protein [Balneolaceae bacterium]|nr:porin family protein [Balneolaceae bacterium]
MPVKTVAQPVEIGVTGGLNTSNILNDFRFPIGDQVLDLESNLTTGFQAGLVVRKPITRAISLQAEPSLMRIGANIRDSFFLPRPAGGGFVPVETDSKAEIFYIHLPVVARISNLPPPQTVYGLPFSYTTFHATGGIFGGYLLDAEFSGTNTADSFGIPFIGEFSNDVTSQFADFDGGIILGGGMEHGNRSKVGFEVRGMLSLMNSGDGPPELEFDTRNMAVTFSLYFIL